jgi:Restriction endonuclease BglII
MRDGATDIVDPPGAVRNPTVTLPGGYRYGVTRYADIILAESFPERFWQLCRALGDFSIELGELQVGGGNRTPFVARFDSSLEKQDWGKRNIKIEKRVDDKPISRVRGHEIDMFGTRTSEEAYPGVAVEMEWSNKDPFFDRDLINYQALHREGALAVGVIVTRGPELQTLIKPVIRNAKGEEKYGESTTHWRKLTPRVDLGGGGECPLLLIGIEPERINGIGSVREAHALILEADALLANWREHGFTTHQEARAAAKTRKAEALGRLPEPAAVSTDRDEET